MIIYYIYYILLFSTSLITIERTKLARNCAIIVFIFLFVLCAFRGAGVDRDYNSYLYNANKMLSRLDYFDYKNLIYYELSYYLIALFSIEFVKSTQLFFVLYAMIGIWLKLKTTLFYTNSFFLSILLYFTSWFLLHEMTQIRAGVAVGILSLAIKDIYNKKSYNFLLKLLLATFFHYSSIFFLPAYFLHQNKINKYILLVLIIFSFIVAYVEFNIFDNPIVSLFSGTKIEEYKFLASANLMKLKVFNGMFIINAFISIILLLKIETIVKYNKYSILFVKLNSLSIIIYLVFSSIPMIAVRVAELYSVVQLFLFPCLIYVFRNRYLGYASVIALSGLYLFMNLHYSQMIYDYKLFF